MENVIDNKKAEKAFKEYVKKYNPNDKKIKLKIEHIQRVAKIAKNIAQDLELSEEDIQLAELIGFLHDIGRFEQIRLYHTFVDHLSVNHAEQGVKILFEEGLIREFIQTDKYDEIIKTAILNHNTPEIKEGLQERENLHSKIIRDADKTDIFYILVTGDKETIWESKDLSKEKISDEIYREFIEDKELNYKNRKSPADNLVAHFAYVYNFYFKRSLQIIKDNNYIDRLYERHKFEDEKTMKRYNEIYKNAKQYIDKSVK